ncbi:MAG: hypothetical protein OEV26_01335, partial [Gallionella sp.]|nr:hypothetical protein [Gallionella sp.]
SLSAGSRNDLAETSQQDQERQRKEAQAQLNAKQQSRNRNEEQLQQQARQNGQARNNSRASTSKTGGDNDRQAQDQYLRDLAAATHLKAQNCYGDYLVSGKFPKILPELVGCVDVHFRAYCPGSAQGTDGTISNWVPFAGCLGSTGEIKPKPSCKAQDLRVEVIEIVRGKGACGG